MTTPRIPLPDTRHLDDASALAAARAFRDLMQARRSVRDFASTPVPRETIEACIAAAASAPNGANRQPWHFVAVSDPAVKRAIREAAEEEERAFYGGRAPQEWLDALRPFDTDAHKPFLEHAPWLIAVFAERYATDEAGGRQKNYYIQESVGIACGMLLAALHHAGLATLTHTPSPMEFLRETLERPERERPYMLIVVGRPAPECTVPDIQKKPLSEVLTVRDDRAS